MLDRKALAQAEALALRLIRLADVRHEAGDHEGEMVARSMVDALCDVIDLEWMRERRAQA
jgi:hypothetical protein